MNVHNVYLQGDLNEEIYMEVPQGFFLLRGGGLKWHTGYKNPYIYDLKQAPK